MTSPTRSLERTGGRGVDVILNSLPGEAIPRGLAALADYGRFLEIGKRDIYQNARLGLQPFHKNLSFFAIDLDRVIRERPALLGIDRCETSCDAWTTASSSRSRTAHGRSATSVDALRFMQHGKHIGKVVLTFRDQAVAAVPAEDEPVTFRADASYLITGGLGGFGLAVARWMAERGAGTLVLVGRRGADTPEARQAVAELEQLGAGSSSTPPMCRRKRTSPRCWPRSTATCRRSAACCTRRWSWTMLC